MASKVRIKLVRSGIGRPTDQKKTLRGMGLTRRGRNVSLDDTAEVRGMLRKVSHLVEVTPVEED